MWTTRISQEYEPFLIVKVHEGNYKCFSWPFRGAVIGQQVPQDEVPELGTTKLQVAQSF